MKTTLLLLLTLSGCDRLRAAARELVADRPSSKEVEAEPATTPEGTGATATGDDATLRVEVNSTGVHVGEDDGVHVGSTTEGEGVRVGGTNGVVVGDQEEVAGVQIGGEQGVQVGKTDETTGVRVGGEKGVAVGKGGVSVGGKKIVFGK